MRYYQIFVDDTSGPLGQVAVKNWTSYANGANIPGALNVEFDFPVYEYSLPQGACYLKLHGISLADIGQASNLNGLNIRVYGGMQKGLPLANPSQAGLLISGTIQQCFGNWIGTDQTLDFVIVYGGDLGSVDAPKNIVLNWQAGQPLADAIKTTLQTAFPTRNLTVTINPALITAYTDTGFFNSIQQLAAWVEQKSIAIIGAKTPDGADYSGVQITMRNGGISVYDNTADAPGLNKSNPKIIAFNDLIGQPTWLNIATLSLKTVLRADLQVNDYVKLPPTTQISQASAQTQARDKSVFQGVFKIKSCRHLGNFRQTDAGSWVTVYEVVAA